MNKALMKQISRAMREQGVGRAELARRVGVDRTMISRWLNGVQVPPVARLQEIANVLKIDLIIAGSHELKRIKAQRKEESATRRARRQAV